MSVLAWVRLYAIVFTTNARVRFLFFYFLMFGNATRTHALTSTQAIGMAAVLYVFRTLVPDSIPLNEGCLKPLRIILPEGSMINPLPPAAVVAGNTEVSQMITETLYVCSLCRVALRGVVCGAWRGVR